MPPEPIELRADSPRFRAMCEAVLASGHSVRFRAEGESMVPNIQPGDTLVVSPASKEQVRRGEIVFFECADGLRAHRVVSRTSSGHLITRGDAGRENDLPLDHVLGKVVAIERQGHAQVLPSTGIGRTTQHAIRILSRRLRLAAARRLRNLRHPTVSASLLLVFGILLLGAQPAAAQADLTMTQAVSVSTIPVGVNYNYTETATNNGPNAVPANTLVVYQQTPANTTFQGITATNWTCNTPGAGNAGPIICTYNLALNSGANTPAITITMQVNGGTAAGTTIQNSATITSQTTDPVPTNNTTVTTITVEPAGDADISVSMTALPTPVFISSNLTYTAIVTNLGPAAATAVTLTDNIPAGTTFVSATPSAGTCTGTTSISCALGTIAANASVTVTIVVGTPSNPVRLSDTVNVATTATDPTNADNSATVVTVVQPLVCASPGRDGAGGTLTGIVNAYYPPSGAVVRNAGSTSITLGPVDAGGAQKAIAIGDLLLVIQMQDAAINSTNTGAYGDGAPGDPATGSTNLNSSGEFEFVTATNAVALGGGLLRFQGTGVGGGLLNTYTEAAFNPGVQGQRVFQVVRVPQYTSATLSSTLQAMPWNGATGGVLALDVSSQLTLGGTVSLDAAGFRGGGGVLLTGDGGIGANTDYVTPVANTTNGSKGEGIAGTPEVLAPATITTTTVATDSGVDSLPNGSYARGAPGNAGGGGTDGDPANNDFNSGGGAGGNGGAGGLGGYGWNSFTALNSTNGGFGGAAFPASSSALVMGGAGGAGTTNNGSYFISATNHDSNSIDGACTNVTCTGIFSSGGAGGGIAIIHAGSVAGAGTITANGQSTLSTDNDSTGGGGAGGSILLFANSGGLGGLTASAHGGNAGNAWPEQAPGNFPGQRHGPGGGGGGGIIFLTAAATTNVSGGLNGSTNTAQDSFGATPGQAGVAVVTHIITETPGTQSGAYCGSADLAVTNVGAPNPVLAGPGPGNIITYAQSVTVLNATSTGDALNAIFTEAIPANTTFQSFTNPVGSGWICNTPAVGATGTITCTNPDFAKGATTNFTAAVAVNTGVAPGTIITDVIDATSGTSDPNLANNSALVQTAVAGAGTADLSITNTATPNPVLAGNNITYTVVVKNNGVATANTVVFSEPIPANTIFVSATPVPAAGWSCGVAGGILSCSNPSLAAGASTTFTVVLNVTAGTSAGTVISDTATVNSATTDPNPNNNDATANVVVASAGQSDFAITSTASPSTVVSDGNNVSYTQQVTNHGPAAGAATFTDTIPAGTTFVSFVRPAGWNCGATIPPVGGTGTISCTIASLAVNATANFPLVVKVSLGDASGTQITNTAAVNTATCPTPGSTSASDPNCANNFASTTVTVASPSQADVAILKTASPEPVDQGTNLTYTLQVTNNGPAVATGVTVSDPIPAEVVFSSVSTTQGTCTYNGGTTTVSCTLGNISVGGLVIITINVTASTFSSSSLSTNTATVTANTSDPNLTNNSSTAITTIAAPTAIQLVSFRVAPSPEGGAILEWKTREEVRNLGFNVYREDFKGRHRLNPSLVAGSALVLRGGRPQHGAKTYQWLDPAPMDGATYWLEDVDLSGARILHGPAQLTNTLAAPRATLSAQLLTHVNQIGTNAVTTMAPHLNRPFQPLPRPAVPANVERVLLDREPALKILVRSEGWYHLSASQIAAAGFNLHSNSRYLQLFAEGIEQPLLVLGNQSGPLDRDDGIEFYGTGIDTPYSDARVYWLVNGHRPGKRIDLARRGISGSAEPSSFPFTVLRQDRTTYFAALLNGEDQDNFFGDIITSVPIGETLTVVHSAATDLPISLDITLQGGTDNQDHEVSVTFNNAFLGNIAFSNLALFKSTMQVDSTLLHDGDNTVTLVALNGDNDVSLVQSVELHYAHTYAVDSNWLRMTASSGSHVHLTGFTSPRIRVFDISDPLNIDSLEVTVRPTSSDFAADVEVPATSLAGHPHTLLAFSVDQLSTSSELAFHPPSRLTESREGADILIVTHPNFVTDLTPLERLRREQGHTVEVVTIDEIFDAYNFGERSPYAVRDFFEFASTGWHRHPRSILLVGAASLDPRNYLGIGDFDFVPTRLVDTAAFKTASDDWFTDFTHTGFGTIPIGRLLVRTPADADLVVGKIVNYERGSFAGTWNTQALVVSDQNVDADFSDTAKTVANSFASIVSTNTILSGDTDSATARQNILAALNQGQLLVNYVGHGSVEQWSFSDLFNDTDASSLQNGNALPAYILMDCLNGFFQDPTTISLAESLLLAPNGGAVAVWASSGFTDAGPQASMNRALAQILVSNPSIPLGKAILLAKSQTGDSDVRRTWNLLGDPAMHLHFTSASAPSHSSSGGNSGPAQRRFPNNRR